MLFPVMFYASPTVASEEENEEFVLTNGAYRLRIEASQWEYKIYDINRAAEDDRDLEFTSDAVKDLYLVRHRVVFNEKGADVQFNLYSRDVQHGFAVNELGILVATNRPGVGEEFGAPVQVEFNTGNKDVTYSGFCHIFCGLGHPDMKLKFVIGAGSPETGKAVFYTILVINVGIFGFGLFKLADKMKVRPAEEVPA